MVRNADREALVSEERAELNRRALARQLDGARFVQYDETTGLHIAWHGGHTVHVYNYEGREVAGWCAGDYSQRTEEVTLGEIQASIQERMQDKDYPWYE